MRPLFSYFGGKWRAAPRYPRPEHEIVVEPFAGSAGYAVRWNAPRALLIDADERVVGTWQYLIRTSREEIDRLPDLEIGQTVDDLDVCQEAKWLIGWWLSTGSAQPKRTQGQWARKIMTGDHGWGRGGKAGWRPMLRTRIACQVDLIREWRVQLGTYRDAPDIEATWFIDPPYVEAGRFYRSSHVDYTDIARFVVERRGLAIACEQDGATWLPFRDLGTIKGTSGAGRTGTSCEVVHIQRR